MSSNLITTKLMRPVPPLQVVERPQLKKQLETGLATKLILIAAPAGSGKSTLLASWLKELDRSTAWLSLDASDNDLERFLLYLMSAFQQVEPGLGAGLPELLQTQNPVQPEPIIIRIINEAAQLNRKLILVFDDYHLITNKKVHDAVDFLLDHLPSQLCLVIATRTDPPLALSRLRVNRQMVEIRADDLHFSLRETTDFLNGQLGLELSSSAIARLDVRTEGWIAGLQLVGLSLQGHNDKEAFITAFTGSHRYLADYLVAEVLQQQTPEVRRFLQRTSILERFTASLCESVSEQLESGDMLERLVNANLFVIPLDDEGKWYRYHHLFAEFLQHGLRNGKSERIAELHLRASAWFEQEGWTDEAVHHAFLASDDKLAARLVEDVAFDLAMHWNNAQLIKYVRQLPVALLPCHPRLAIYYSWALANTGQSSALKKVLPLLKSSQAYSQEPRTVAATVVTSEAYEGLRQLDFANATKLCQQALSLLEPPTERPSDEERLAVVAATNLMAYSYLHSNLACADQIYPLATERSLEHGNIVGVINSFARWGWVKHHLGRLHAAMDSFRQGLDTLEYWRVEVGLGKGVVNVGELHLNLAQLLYEWNRLPEADTHVRQARNLNELSQFPPVLALEFETSFYLHLTRGEIEAAYALLAKLDRLVARTNQDNPLFKQRFETMAMKGRLTLAAHTPNPEHLLAEVAGWVTARGLGAEASFDYANEGSYEIMARLLLAQDKPAEAYALLQRLAQAAQGDDRRDDLIRHFLLQALASQVLGHEKRALQTLHQALNLGEPEGYCRSFVDKGPALQALLQQAANNRNTPYISRLLKAFPSSASPAAEATTGPASLATPALSSEPETLLNDRERTILRLLAAGNSHKQIAKTINLSPNTIRWYMQSLYAKLQVSNRTAAINRARDAGLL